MVFTHNPPQMLFRLEYIVKMPPKTRKTKTATKKRKRKPTVITFQFTDDPVWSCPLTCATCAYQKRDGNMCKNRVCFGTPLCWSHNKVLYGVKIKELGEKNAGKELFATKVFEPNEWVCP